jgi:hypothetical protein
MKIQYKVLQFIDFISFIDIYLSLSLHFFELKIFPSERHSFLNLSAPVLNFSGDKGKIFTFKPAQKSAGSAINMSFSYIIMKIIMALNIVSRNVFWTQDTRTFTCPISEQKVDVLATLPVDMSRHVPDTTFACPI